MLRSTLAAAALIALAACGATGTGTEPGASEAAPGGAPSSRYRPLPGDPAVPAPDEPDAGTCGADKLDRWLNVLPTDTVKAEIAATVGQRPIRYYAQGDPITMDFSESRLNVELGEDGRIKHFRCG